MSDHPLNGFRILVRVRVLRGFSTRLFLRFRSDVPCVDDGGDGGSTGLGLGILVFVRFRSGVGGRRAEDSSSE